MPSKLSTPSFYMFGQTKITVNKSDTSMIKTNSDSQVNQFYTFGFNKFIINRNRTSRLTENI